MRITFDNPDTVPAPPGVYSHVARVDSGDGALLFVAGQIAVDETGALVGEDDMTAQSHQVLGMIERILAAHGASFSDVVQIRTFLTDMDRLAEYAAARKVYHGEYHPTSTTVEVSRLFHPGALLEVEVVAAVRSVQATG